MSKRVYKYFSADVFELVLPDVASCNVKCSLPKDYNDPYELYLGADFAVSTELLATYREAIQEVPQFPTTCFSMSPVVTPMWAHYANNHTGFVLEFDVEKLKAAKPDIQIQDISYRDEPDEQIAGHLRRAAGTKKPRHTMWLRDAVIFNAYFSKQTCWNYEQECRLVASGKLLEEITKDLILSLPIDCITAIIVGSNFDADDMLASKSFSEKSGLNWYQSIIGKSNPQPYFRDLAKEPLTFDGEGIVSAQYACGECREPTATDQDLCPWCAISEHHEWDAARDNPLRLMDRLGALDSYLEGIANIRNS